MNEIFEQYNCPECGELLSFCSFTTEAPPNFDNTRGFTGLIWPIKSVYKDGNLKSYYLRTGQHPTHSEILEKHKHA